MKIAIDAMGGDLAPQSVVDGALLAAKEMDSGTELILVGDERRIRESAKSLSDFSNVSVVHARETVEMHETPVLAIRQKKDSSILKAVSLVKEGLADAVVSAGNTGAVVAATKIKWRSLPGVERPAIAAVMPSPYGVFVVLDVGATPGCKPEYLSQFAVMGEMYAIHVLGMKHPKVGLLSLGQEETKGTELTKDAYKFIHQKLKHINFVGNVEGNDLFTDRVDVIVCDGFTGNVILKVCESLAGAFQYIVREEIMKDTWAKIGAIMMKPAFRRISKKVHYEEYGGAPLLGVNGTCIISHGRSTPLAIKNAIKTAATMVRNNLNARITEAVSGI